MCFVGLPLSTDASLQMHAPSLLHDVRSFMSGSVQVWIGAEGHAVARRVCTCAEPRGGISCSAAAMCLDMRHVVVGTE
jgi:hypothetical protein